MENEPLWYHREKMCVMIRINSTLAKKIFILEDCPDRISWFKQKLHFAEITTTDKPRMAVHLLDQQKYDLIFLDHDLGITFHTESNEHARTGLWVAKHLQDTINKETDCIIHTVNPEGAGQMVHAHPFNTVHVPFTFLMDSIEVY